MKQIFVILGCLISVVLTVPAFAGIYDELTPEQQKTLQSGQPVVVTEDVAHSVWPKITVYQRVEATSEEATAVLADYELQPSYMPYLSRAKIVARPDRASAVVEYRMSVLIMHLDYTLTHRVGQYDRGNSYKLDWNFVKGEKLKDIQGGARFENLGTGTIIRYWSLIVPNSSSVADYKDRAIKGIRDGMIALKKQINKERSSNPALLEKQREVLRAALRRHRPPCPR